MPALSTRAADILEQMEPDLGYQMPELRQIAPDLSAEALSDVMRELWIDHQVERFGYTGWRRVRPAAEPQQDSRSTSSGPVKIVKPEELFDHDAFSGFFK